MRSLMTSLRGIVEGPEEIIVVDASPDDATKDAVQEFDDLPLRYFHVGSEHRGLTRQRNYATQKTTGDIILFLDDDIIPAPDFFVELRACWLRHPEAVGVGGYLGEDDWVPVSRATRGLQWFCVEGWARREPLRWQVRRLLGLASQAPPGWMPPEGNGRPSQCYPPDGEDRIVEFVMGGVSSWRAAIARQIGFSLYFEGYGLYEDMDFSIRAGKYGLIYLCTRARAEHRHDPAGRPRHYRYGYMVSVNGWYVWRLRWRDPGWKARLKWWLTSFLLLGIRFTGGRDGFVEACGRLVGLLRILVRPPSVM